MQTFNDLELGDAGGRTALSDAVTLEFERWDDEPAPSYARGRGAQAEATTQELESWVEETAPSYARAATHELARWAEEATPGYARPGSLRRDAKRRKPSTRKAASGQRM